MFKIIVCTNFKRAIGKDGNLLYHIKDDLTNFKKMTTGNVIIMGRKTFESLPGGKPLSNRINIILTTDVEYGVEPDDNVFITHSVEETVELCQAFFSDKECFVIGGESIYKQFMDKNLVSEMRVTLVHDNTNGDTHFPEYTEDEWRNYYDTSVMKSEDETPLLYSFHIFKKKDSK
jgi:dihydrofolate reductase